MPARSQAQAEQHAARARLVHASEDALRGALIEQERPLDGMYLHASREVDAAFDRAIREVCDEAHRLDLRAEDMLVALKQAWSRLALLRARQLGDHDGDVLRDVVSTSIEVFFEQMSPGSGRCSNVSVHPRPSGRRDVG